MDLTKTFTLPTESIFTHSEIESFRNETLGCRSVIHLNNAGAALMPDVVIKAQVDHIMLEAVKGGYEASALKADTIKEFYEQAALLLNCTPSNIAFTSSATDSYSRALSSIPFKVGDVILTDNDGFVSNQIQFLSLQRRLGVKIVHVKNAEKGGIDLYDLQQKLRHLRPKLLAITYIPTNSGLMQPVDDIAKIYRDYLKNTGYKTWYILDACQAVGQMKLDVQKLHCDFLSFTGRKFLRGPRGTGVLYISDDTLIAGLEPMFIDMRGAEWTGRGSYKQQPDAKRFEDWEFAYSTVVGTMEAIKYCRNIGEDRIWQQVKLLSDLMRKELAEMDNVKVFDRGSMQGGLVTFNIKDSNPDHIVSELAKRKINVVASYRAYGVIDFDEKGVKWVVRASPHYYNTLDEIEYFIAALKEIIIGR